MIDYTTFMNKVAAFQEKYDYPEEREEYTNKVPTRDPYTPNAIGGAAIGALAMGIPGLLIGKGKAGAAIGAAVGAATGLNIARKENKEYHSYQTNPVSYKENREKEYYSKILPSIQSNEDYYAKWGPKHQDNVGMTEQQAREKYRNPGSTHRDDLWFEAAEAEEEDGFNKKVASYQSKYDLVKVAQLNKAAFVQGVMHGMKALKSVITPKEALLTTGFATAAAGAKQVMSGESPSGLTPKEPNI